jgi:arylsulfatase A-like enzyme
VPFLVSWPARIPAGRTYSQPIIALDILPTALAAAGTTRDAKLAALDGVDLLPFLTDKNNAAPHARLFWRMDGGEAFAVREGHWKWLRTYQNAPQLYDLSTDLGENRDVAASHPEIATRLATAAADWNRGLIAPAFGNNPFGGLINRTGLEKDLAP